MAYCSAEDIYKIIPQAQVVRLTDDEGTGAVNADRLTEAIADASETIDVYIADRADLPIADPVPPILGKWCADMAVYNLYSRVMEEIPPTRAERHKAAIRALEQVAAGKLSLGIQPAPAPPDEGDYNGAAAVSARDKMFDPDTMEKY